MNKSYRPSNGTEGTIFMAQFCDRCTKDDCWIIIDTFRLSIDDPEYPKEWTFDEDGEPTCTAFTAFSERPQDETPEIEKIHPDQLSMFDKD